MAILRAIICDTEGCQEGATWALYNLHDELRGWYCPAHGGDAFRKVDAAENMETLDAVATMPPLVVR